VSEPQRIARQVVVRGLVQGVFFRDSTRREAIDAGVDGWVRNEYDGTVRALFEGPPAAVDRLVDWMREGPRNAIVESVEVSDAEPDEAHGFQVC
jgi:acylphosphatase